MSKGYGRTQSIIIESLKRYGCLSLSDLIRITQSSQPTVSRAANGLIKRGIIKVHKVKAPSLGRNVTYFMNMYELN